MIQLIIFDWDDVFTTGSTKAYFKCYHETLVELAIKLPPTEEEKRIKAKWGRTVKEELNELLKENPQLIDKAIEIYEKILMSDTFTNCLTLTTGSDKLIERLSKVYKLAIASGINPRLLKDKIFPKFGINNLFSQILTVYDLDDPSHAKPHPFLLSEIMKRLNIGPQETIMVGDAPGDVKMAQSINITPIVVLTGHLNEKEAKNLGVKYIIPDVTHLEKVLNILNK